MSDSDLNKLNRYMGGTDDAAQFTTPIGESGNVASVHTPQSLQDKIAYMRNSAQQLVKAEIALADAINGTLKTLPFKPEVRMLSSHGYTYTTITIRFWNREAIYIDELEKIKNVLSNLLKASIWINGPESVGLDCDIRCTVTWGEG